MSSASKRKTCSIASDCKQTAATNCEGCSQAFCTKHFIDHRRLLTEDMDAIISEHNHFQALVNEQSVEVDLHPLTQTINDWEQKSIKTIQNKASDLRQELLQLITTRRNDLTSKLRQLAVYLTESRESDNFLEIDLEQWKYKLEDLKTKFESSSIYTFDRHDNVPLVPNTSISLTIENELFEQIFDSTAKIFENGQVISHDISYSYVEIRGRNQYTSGCHTIRLRIEQSEERWMFLGINSKSELLQKQSFNSKSAYGWTNNNYFWLNGECQPNIFDCDQQKISMINERTNAKYDLFVNINHCPFPWQLHVNLYEANSHVRILSA
ncbi:hypothetical protein I4U23_002929 [Adineta vaga]|nr:hypothetical protein I4U23_002929 [Adineta vaga]